VAEYLISGCRDDEAGALAQSSETPIPGAGGGWGGGGGAYPCAAAGPEFPADLGRPGSHTLARGVRCHRRTVVFIPLVSAGFCYQWAGPGGRRRLHVNSLSCEVGIPRRGRGILPET